MEPQFKSTREYFRSLTIVHYVMLLGQVLFAVIAWILNLTGNLKRLEDQNELLLIIVPIATIGAFAGSLFLFRNKINNLRGNGTLEEKLTGYRSALIVKHTILEMAAFFSLIIFLLTSNKVFFILAAILIVLLAFYRPTKERTNSELELSNPERELLNNPD